MNKWVSTINEHIDSNMSNSCPQNSWVSESTLTENKRSMSNNDLFTIQYSLRPSLIGLSNSCDFIPLRDDDLSRTKFRHSTGLPHIFEAFNDNHLKPESSLSHLVSPLSPRTDNTDCLENETKSNLNNKTKKTISFSLRRVFSWRKLDRESSDVEMTLSKIQNIHLANYLQCKLYHKWNKMWCVVAEGNFYCFKSSKQNEKIHFFLHLANSQLKYSSPSLNGHINTHKTFFIEIISPKKFILLNASSSSDQVFWINTLTKERVSVLKASDSQKIPCCEDNVCSLCSHFSSSIVPTSLAPATELPELTSSEKSDYHSVSSFIDEKDHGYTTASDDFDNQSSVGSQNGIAGSYTPPSLRALAHEVALKLPESDTFSFEENFSKAIPERNNNNWNTDSKMMAHISRTKIIPPTLTPANKSCNAQSQCSPSHNETKSLAHTTTLAVSTPHSVVSKRPKSLPLVENLFTDTIKGKIDQLSSALSVTSLHLQPQTEMSGYLERRTSSEEWAKFWFVLKGNVLYCYPKYENQSMSIDCIDLNGSHVVAGSEPLAGRHFTFQITTKDGSCSEYCGSTEDSLTNWMNHLLTATESCSTSSPSIGSEGFFSSREDLTAYDAAHSCEECKDKTKILKQQLLSDMVQQIKDIKQRQELRQNAESENEACDKESMCMTRLVQRRMSAQITLQSIQKQISSQNKKSIFSFGVGNKKKGNLNQKHHLVNQVEELNQELEQIDRSLHRHCTNNPEMAIQTNAHLLSPESQTKQSSGLKHISSISKSFHISSKSRLGLMRPVKLRNNRQTKENRFTTPRISFSSGTESPTVNLNIHETLPNSSENMFLNSLDLAESATKTLSQCRQSDPKQNTHHSYAPDQMQHFSSIQTNPSDKKSNLKISSEALSEIEAFEDLSKKYFTKQVMLSNSSA